MSKKILLHICCAPCACYPIKVLKEEFEVFGLWYNPNIHPFNEYKRRLEEVKKLEDIFNIKIIYIIDYPLETWIQDKIFREDKKIRCKLCYYDRLKRTVSVCKNGKFDFWTSTLFYSKFQNHDLMIEVAISLSNEYKVNFFYKDFREGWKEGIEASKSFNLYRQNYCGCIYSEKERYKNEIKKLKEVYR